MTCKRDDHHGDHQHPESYGTAGTTVCAWNPQEPPGRWSSDSCSPPFAGVESKQPASDGLAGQGWGGGQDLSLALWLQTPLLTRHPASPVQRKLGFSFGVCLKGGYPLKEPIKMPKNIKKRGTPPKHHWIKWCSHCESAKRGQCQRAGGAPAVRLPAPCQGRARPPPPGRSSPPW